MSDWSVGCCIFSFMLFIYLSEQYDKTKGGRERERQGVQQRFLVGTKQEDTTKMWATFIIIILIKWNNGVRYMNKTQVLTKQNYLLIQNVIWKCTNLHFSKDRHVAGFEEENLYLNVTAHKGWSSQQQLRTCFFLFRKDLFFLFTLISLFPSCLLKSLTGHYVGLACIHQDTVSFFLSFLLSSFQFLFQTQRESENPKMNKASVRLCRLTSLTLITQRY